MKKDSNWNASSNRPHSWDHHDDGWYVRYLELIEYKKEEGDCMVPRGWSKNRSLGIWVSMQRVKRKKMVSWRRELLDALNFTWAYADRPISLSWKTHYNKLVKFREEYGDCNVPRNYKDQKLALWVKEQRNANSNNRLYKKRKELLDELGFVWQFFKCKPAETWEQYYQKLVNFKKKFRHLRIPDTSKDEKWLGLKSWTIQQRSKYKVGILSELQISQLNALDFCWNPHRAQWDKRYKWLLDYYQKHGRTKVDNNDKENSSLRHWIANQSRHKARLAPDQTKLLDDLNFVWVDLRRGISSKYDHLPKKEAFWMTRFDQLQAYQNQFNHCSVPGSNKTHPNLGQWVIRQRSLFKKNKLSKEQIGLLNSLDFEWLWKHKTMPPNQPRKQEQWLERLEELRIFQKEHGHCVVPKETKTLNLWISRQRRIFKKNTLSQERIDLLNNTVPDWSNGTSIKKEKRWMERFEQLKDFQKTQGHLKIPFSDKSLKRLYHWTFFQRFLYKKDKLAQNRMDFLNSIGFDWSPWFSHAKIKE